MSLEKQLADLAEIHGLDAIGINYLKLPSGRVSYSVCVHRNCKCAGDVLYGDNIAAAFKNSLTRLNSEISPVVFEAFGSEAA